VLCLETTVDLIPGEIVQASGSVRLVPASESLFHSILRTMVTFRRWEQGSGRESHFACEYRVARTGEAGEMAFPARADHWHATKKSFPAELFAGTV
jgi:hypothetical protein